jgi:hypothetical protein
MKSGLWVNDLKSKKEQLATLATENPHDKVQVLFS